MFRHMSVPGNGAAAVWGQRTGLQWMGQGQVQGIVWLPDTGNQRVAG